VTEILIVVHSVHGNTLAMGRQVARGVEQVSGCQGRLRAVAPITSAIEPRQASLPESGPALVSVADLGQCDGLIIGSPTRFGNMAAAVKYFLDGTGSEWISGTLVGKPAGVFTSTATLHGGQESTLLSMMIPLLHHGMVVVGLPFTEPGLNHTTSGGTPYGASHLAGADGDRPLDDTEMKLCRALGRRVAEIAHRLKSA
jgi:NAD(P)H dehydrogenase (quinone)